VSGSTRILLLVAVTVTSCTRHPATPPVSPQTPDNDVHIWRVGDRVGSPPLTLSKLQGKVILVRWIAPAVDCPVGAAAASALNSLNDEFTNRGLFVLAFYPRGGIEAPELRKLKRCSQDSHVRFPMIVGLHGEAFGRWQDGGPAQDHANVTFLIDKRGIIRRFDPDDTLILGTKEYDDMRTTIAKVLAE
jgi:peroxiredoxin